MNGVVRETLAELEETLARDLISRTSNEMTQSKAIEYFIHNYFMTRTALFLFQEVDLQGALSDQLVAIGGRYCFAVMESLMQKFQPGVLPNFFVVQTMANLATVNRAHLSSLLHLFKSHKYKMIVFSYSVRHGPVCKEHHWVNATDARHVQAGQHALGVLLRYVYSTVCKSCTH